MDWEEYLKEELKYYDEHPEENDPIECHSNSSMCLDVALLFNNTMTSDEIIQL